MVRQYSSPHRFMRSAEVIYVQDHYVIVECTLGVARSPSGGADVCQLHA